MKILRIYDNGGKTADRYTVYYDVPETKGGTVKNWYTCIGMDDKPFHPQGIGMHASGMLGRHNGKTITIDQLPFDCQKAVYQDLLPFKVKPLRKLKRKASCWLKTFSNKVYNVKALDEFRENGNITGIVFVCITGPEDYDYQLVYPDECIIVEN